MFSVLDNFKSRLVVSGITAVPVEFCPVDKAPAQYMLLNFCMGPNYMGGHVLSIGFLSQLVEWVWKQFLLIFALYYCWASES